MNNSTNTAGRNSGRATLPAAFSEQDYGRFCVGFLLSTPYQRVSASTFSTESEAAAALADLQRQHRRPLSIARMPTLAEQAEYAVTLRSLIAADRLEEAEVMA